MNSQTVAVPVLNRLRRFAPYFLAGVVLALAVTAYVAGLAGYIDADAIIAHRDMLQRATNEHPGYAILVFVVTYIVAMSCALPLGGILCLLAGLLFGRWLGLAVVVPAAAVSALCVFLFARTIFGETLRRRGGAVYDQAAQAMQANGFAYLLFMRIVPVFPFFVVNLVAALLGMRARTFVLATLAGKVPVVFIYAGLGEEIGKASHVDDLVTFEALAALTALGMLALAPLLLRRIRRSNALFSSETSSG